MSPTRVLVVGLAAFRGARAVTHDEISRTFRDRTLVDWGFGSGPSPRREFIVTLVRCPLCLGFWLAVIGVLVGRRRGTPWRIVAIEAWAAAGVQALLEGAAERLDGP